MADEPKKLEWSALLKKLTDIEVGTPLDVQVQKETIPIVFVPGIMGSRLKRGNDKIWDPDSRGFMFFKYGMVGVDAADKKEAIVGKEFDPEDLKPFENDAEHCQQFADVDQHTPPEWGTTAQRGWGTVSSRTYGDILRALQDAQGVPAAVRALFDFPVYAVGYNWGASNAHSGKKLAKRIGEIVDLHQQKDGLCKNVIVITHSMGGLVTRWAVEKGGAKDKVLGVIHGVQPATGSPGAYWRMKAGFERNRVLTFDLPNPVAWVAGTNGKEVTALLGWLPGGLQLLPAPTYKDNSGSADWLFLYDEKGKQVAAYGANAWDDIYKKDQDKEPGAYWRMIEKSYLLPEERPAMEPADAWDSYCTKVDEAREFHEDIEGKQHPETQAFYGAGKEHPSCDRIEYRPVVYDWRAARKDLELVGAVVLRVVFPPLGVPLMAFEVFKRSEWWESRGAFKVRVETSHGTIDVELQHPSDVAKRSSKPHGAGAGDGTVPECSGKALLQTGDVGKGEEAQGFDELEHEPAFKAERRTKDPKWDPVEFTIQAVVKLCRDRIKKAR